MTYLKASPCSSAKSLSAPPTALPASTSGCRIGACGRPGWICRRTRRYACWTVRVVEFEPVEGGRQRVVTKRSEVAQKVLKALKIRRKPSPGAPDGASETTKSSNVVTIRK